MQSKFPGPDQGKMPARRFLPVILVLIGVASCAPRYQYTAVPAEEQPPPPPTQVYFYPNSGQTPEQQDRDRYECYLWAKQQTGFDPSAPSLAPHNRVVMVPEGPPPGTGTAVGAVTGALLGAAVASHHNKPQGALVGAIAGGILGTAAEAANQQQAAAVAQSYNAQQANQRAAAIELQASDYRRALAACLEGRGYTVK